MTASSDFQKALVDELCQKFDCSRQDAKEVAQQADKMRKSMEANSGGIDDFQVTIDLIIEKLGGADEGLGLVGKWNWYAGSIGFIDERKRDFTV